VAAIMLSVATHLAARMAWDPSLRADDMGHGSAAFGCM